jgi:hypothetical protein
MKVGNHPSRTWSSDCRLFQITIRIKISSLICSNIVLDRDALVSEYGWSEMSRLLVGADSWGLVGLMCFWIVCIDDVVKTSVNCVGVDMIDVTYSFSRMIPRQAIVVIVRILTNKYV